MKLMFSWTTCLDHEVSGLLRNMQEEYHFLVGKDCCLWGSENSVWHLSLWTVNCLAQGTLFPE